MTKQKSIKTPEPHWKELSSELFAFFYDKFNCPPPFDPMQKRFFRLVVKALRERAQAKNIYWDDRTAIIRLRRFLNYAYDCDQWLRENFTMLNLYRLQTRLFRP